MEFEKKALIGASVKMLNTHVLKLAGGGFNALTVQADEILIGWTVGEHVVFALDHQAKAGMCKGAGLILATTAGFFSDEECARG